MLRPVRCVVVLPTYQEAANITPVLRRIRATGRAEVVVVDDASPDGTADLAEAVAAELGGISVLRRPGKAGFGPACRAGMLWALEEGYEVIVGMDADCSHDPAQLPDLLEAVEAGADLVVGSRYVPGGSIPDWPVHRRALSRWGNRYATAALRLPLSDATSGYRAYRAETLRLIDLGHVRADGYGFLIEMAYRMDRQGGRLAEVPIVFTDRTRDDSKMSLTIVAEAMALVTLWGLRDRLPGHRRPRPRPGPDS
ncbi:MAG: polyprenol monophosphomannose synthase [Acidimicrobiales bacterium]